MERKEFARQATLDEVLLDGLVALPRAKYISYSGQLNWCQSANYAWLSSWRGLAGQKADLDVIQVGDQVLLIDPRKAKTKGTLSSFA